MRKFYLKNSLGQEWNLNDVSSFFHTVKGLGQDYKTTYTQIGNRFLKTKSNLSQKKINGKVRFKGYEDFNDFSKFIQHKPLTLIYGDIQSGNIYPPVYPENKDYLLDVVISSLEKAELETGGLQCKITFESLGTYYRIVNADGVADSEATTVTIESDTVLDSGMKIEIQGPCTNPQYTHYIDGVEKCSGRFLCEIEYGKSMVIDTTKIPYEVKEYSSDGEILRDLYGMSDFSTVRFLNLGYGNNTIVFTQEGTDALTVSVEARIEYESV